jgi:DNA mismatch repair protein MutL
MSDVIKLLPDHIANQIAAGEVIQRPSSVVKELVENAIDAGATRVDVVIKDAGKTLIQVIDNGFGMSENDTYLAFERHATSKVASVDDLYALQTKGFRGEALASIAAIAHVELKTKQPNNELGTIVQIEGSEIKSVEPGLVPNGSCFSVKNLFFNVPARRNFLKSESVEAKHIVEEFMRIALTHYEVGFSLHHNGSELYKVDATNNLRKRIVDLLGKSINDKLVPVEEYTDIIGISGFVVKPEYSKKTPGEQYFFVNNRFFKDRYFHHSIKSAFENLIPKDHQPSYFIYFTVSPASIDVNVHPTKTEIKFEEDRSIYAIIKSSVRQALGKYNIAPTLDFDQEMAFPHSKPAAGEPIRIPTIQVNPNYNPFDSSTFKTTSTSRESGTVRTGNSFNDNELYSNSKPKSIKPNKSDWEDFYAVTKDQQADLEELKMDFTTKDTLNSESSLAPDSNLNIEPTDNRELLQIQKKYILSPVKNGFFLIDQHRAHVRILYDDLMSQFMSTPIASQQLLFPIEKTVNLGEKEFWESHNKQINRLGFNWEWNDLTLIVTGVPYLIKENKIDEYLENLLHNLSIEDIDAGEFAHTLILSLSKSSAIQAGDKLQKEEMLHIIEQLFQSKEPGFTPNGKRILKLIDLKELTHDF